MRERAISPATGELHAVRIAAHPRNRDRRMGQLIRLGDITQPDLLVDRLLDVDLPELPVEVIRRIGRPELEDHIERLEGHCAANLRIDRVELVVGRHTAGSETEIQPALGKMVQK